MEYINGKEYLMMCLTVVELEILEEDVGILSFHWSANPNREGGCWRRGQQESYFKSVWIVLFKDLTQSWHGGKIQE